MSRIDLGDNILKPKTVPATVEGFWKRVDAKKTRDICAELADILEQTLRGEMSKEDYKTKKAELKRGANFYTPHAHFNKGYKSNEGEPVDSGKAIVDFDGCENFPELYAQHLMGRERELGVNLVNRSMSGNGGHVLFDIPEGMSRQEAQEWFVKDILEDVPYDEAVHEKERAIFIPCRDFILYIDEDLIEEHAKTIGHGEAYEFDFTDEEPQEYEIPYAADAKEIEFMQPGYVIEVPIDYLKEVTLRREEMYDE